MIQWLLNLLSLQRLLSHLTCSLAVKQQHALYCQKYSLTHPNYWSQVFQSVVILNMAALPSPFMCVCCHSLSVLFLLCLSPCLFCVCVCMWAWSPSTGSARWIHFSNQPYYKASGFPPTRRQIVSSVYVIAALASSLPACLLPAACRPVFPFCVSAL